jgi:hypothetical protein
LGVGIYTDNFHEAKIPLVEIELQTGEEKPFSTETTLLHVTPETQIEVFPEDHHLARVKRVDVVVNGPMVAAETLFSERYACTEHEAFNALVRRGDITVNVLRDPDKGLAILDQDGRKKDIVYFPGNGPTESA